MRKIYSLIVLGSVTLSAMATAPLAGVNARLAKAQGSSHPLKSRVISRASNLSAPTVLPATDVTETGFTANWKAVPGAATYTLSVYNPVTVASDGEYQLLNESFNLVSKGTFSEPYFDDNMVVYLSDYDWTYTPDWMVYNGAFARGMVTGVVYSPYIDLTNDGGKFTVTFDVTGYAGGKVVLKSNGETTEEQTFNLTETGLNTFTHTFTNGVHDTYLTFVDYGVPSDEDNLYSDLYDFLDEITISQNLKKGDLALLPVACEEPEKNTYTFESLPYAYGAVKLAYDVQANIVEWGDPNDPWDYEIFYSPFSDLMYVELGNQQGGEGPVTPPTTDPTDPENPNEGEIVVYVGEFENPGQKEITQGAGSWWERAPFQWYTRYSGTQMIYNAEYLEGLQVGDQIKEIVYKYGDEGSFVEVEADLTLYVENTSVSTFPKKVGTDTYLWVDMDASSSKSEQAYSIELYYMEDEELHFVLDKPLTYEGGNLLVTCWSDCTNEAEAMAVITYAMRTRDYSTMSCGDDFISFPTVYDTGEQFPYMGPNKYLPVTKIVADRNNSVSTIATPEAQAEYYNLQGIRVAQPAAGGVYIMRRGTETQKVYIR